MIEPRNQRRGGLNYFFLDPGASFYDHTIELVVPLYRLAHELAQSLVDDHVGSNVRGDSPLILDIGAGTGAESIPILLRYPKSHLIVLDSAEKMHEQFSQNMARSRKFGEGKGRSHVTHIIADYLTESSAPRGIAKAANVRWKAKGICDIIITALTFHHFSIRDKHFAYDRAFEILRPGGLFVNLDLFGYSAKSLAARAAAFDLRWISTHFRDPARISRAAARIPLRQRERLCSEWLNHYRVEHQLDPIESTSQVAGQLSMLRSAGFISVECPFRYWQVGVICGVKPKQ